MSWGLALGLFFYLQGIFSLYYKEVGGCQTIKNQWGLCPGTPVKTQLFQKFFIKKFNSKKVMACKTRVFQGKM